MNQYSSEKSDETQQLAATKLPKGNGNQMSGDEEVDIWNLVRILWDGRRYVYISTLAFFLLGLFHVSSGPDEYVSDAVLLQEAAGDQSGTQRFLQSLGGFGFGPSSSGGGSAGDLGPAMYPMIVQSIEFQRELISQPIEFNRFDEEMTLLEYFDEYYEEPLRDKVYSFISAYTIQVPFRIFDWIVNFKLFEEEEIEEEGEEEELDQRVLLLSSAEASVIGEVTPRIELLLEGNLITVNTTMPDRISAAMLNVLVIEQIQEYVTEYKVEKARQNVEFTESQLSVAEQRYNDAQRALAEFRDQNINISTNVARTEEESLSNHRDRMFNIYNSLSVEVEQARLRLQEETPVFSVMQKSSIPSRSLGTSNRIIVVFIILGGMFGFLYIFGRLIYAKIKSEVIYKDDEE
jgi:hypothetical protein